MALIVDVRVNKRLVARAGVVNTTAEEADVCDYAGGAFTKAFGERGDLAHSVEIREHDRRVSVWRLVAKIATQLAEKEEAPCEGDVQS